MVRLILVRHGQTPANIDGVLDAAMPGPALTALGRQQAAALPQRLAGHRIERIVSSSLTRTVQTARPLADALGIDPSTDAGLREVLAGDLQGRRDRVAVQAYLDVVFAWAAGDLSARLPGSPEDGRDFFARFDAAVDAAVDGADGAVVCVSHGAAIRTWAAVRGTNLPDDAGRDRGLPNTGVVVLQGAPGSWRVLQWQDDRFADPADDPTGAAEPG